MGKTGIIMSAFFVTATTFSVVENRQHLEQAAMVPVAQPIIESITENPRPNQAPPDFEHDETKIPLVSNPMDELKQAIKLEGKEIGKLKEMQQLFDQQLLAVYQKNKQIEWLEAQNQQHAEHSQRVDATRSVDQALKDWSEHEMAIKRLALKNSSLRQQYLPEEENEGYALNKTLTEKHRAQDKQRAAIDARIRYLNEVYRRQQRYYQRRISPRAYQRASPLPVYQ